MKYIVSTTGADLTQNYANVAGGWELIRSGYGQDGQYFEQFGVESDMPSAFEALLDNDSVVFMYMSDDAGDVE